ncbi:GTPase IMAP family member 4 [Biomphalaria pfeifferi]|uniref:GTPase IMAP family member 4 n=1 Tax=Biomphalaria pfeifferi TaxID=112525 RepID=A0AAD8B0K7_BIOPF|nr:GTPase IMAP family member 4 [Biomphalaria pfeifferi]
MDAIGARYQVTKQPNINLEHIKDIDLLLIGRRGHGKTATINTIIGNNIFESLSKTTYETKKDVFHLAKYQNYAIKLMETSGVMETLGKKDSIEAAKFYMDKMRDAVNLNPKGYHAFLLVFKFGTKFTKRECDSVSVFKQIFGDCFVRNYCILIITFGDNFRTESKLKGISFKQWKSEQDGYFKELRLECQDRVVLFDNSNQRDTIIHNKQMTKLLNFVEHLQNDSNRYTSNNFLKAKPSRDQLLSSIRINKIYQGLEEVRLILELYYSLPYYSVHHRSQTFQEVCDTCNRLNGLFTESESQFFIVQSFINLVIDIKISSLKFSNKLVKIRQKMSRNKELLKQESQRLIEVLHAFIAANEGITDFKADEDTKEADIEVLQDKVKSEFDPNSNSVMHRLIADDNELQKQLQAINTDLRLEIQRYWNSHKLIKDKCDTIMTTSSACQIL